MQYPVSIISRWPISRSDIIFTKTPDINISLVTIIDSNNRGQSLGWAARIMAKKTAVVVFIRCLLFIIFCWWLLQIRDYNSGFRTDSQSESGVTDFEQFEF